MYKYTDMYMYKYVYVYFYVYLYIRRLPARNCPGETCEPSSHTPSEGVQIILFNCFDLYHKSPDSGERQQKSRT